MVLVQQLNQVKDKVDTMMKMAVMEMLVIKTKMVIIQKMKMDIMVMKQKMFMTKV
jgi:hypothetical protein